MSNSLKLAILVKLTELIEQVNPDNTDPTTGEPFEFDLREAVFRGQGLFGREAPRTAVTLGEAPRVEPVIQGGYDEVARQVMVVQIQGWSPEDRSKHPTDPLYRMLDEIETVLSRIIQKHPGTGEAVDPEFHMLGDLIFNIEFGPGIVRPAAETSARAFLYLPLRLSLAVG